MRVFRVPKITQKSARSKAHFFCDFRDFSVSARARSARKNRSRDPLWGYFWVIFRPFGLLTHFSCFFDAFFDVSVRFSRIAEPSNHMVKTSILSTFYFFRFSKFYQKRPKNRWKNAHPKKAPKIRSGGGPGPLKSTKNRRAKTWKIQKLRKKVCFWPSRFLSDFWSAKNP